MQQSVDGVFSGEGAVHAHEGTLQHKVGVAQVRHDLVDAVQCRRPNQAEQRWGSVSDGGKPKCNTLGILLYFTLDIYSINAYGARHSCGAIRFSRIIGCLSMLNARS